jgi:YXWGXW repeat-containing protein
MIRFAALLVAASVLALSAPSWADGVQIENRPAVTKKIKKKRIARKKVVSEKVVVVEEKEAPVPVVLAPALPSPAPVYVPIPVYIWVPGHWTRNPPMNTHVWVPGMYIRPPSSEEQQNLTSRRIGQWIGIGRDY